ncbi:hypothetical protein HDU87_007002 [Geranomyces variabilis]|uniref:RED-like N-terminal domain-containing protein n=1 Tax=Geranomyces variabilis TaxID=109894 RepID=A0AAD5TFS5_9FUNG|nr:hypothetical protein HDU87_007002 [Geranomyces variabilis]
MAGLGQDDFRKLLATPRAALPPQTPRAGTTAASQTPRSGPGGKRDADGFLHPAPRPKKKWQPKKPAKTKTGKEDDEGADAAPAYRDRAKERRQGANPDYAETEQMLAVLRASEEANNNNQSGATVDPTPAGDRADLDAPQQPPPATPGVSYEQSKFLGGDARHTHMVKGLDYALLSRVRSELQTAEELGAEERKAQEYVAQIHGDGGVATFDSVLAANIYDIAITRAKEKPPVRNEMFIPGRMAFMWEFGTMDDVGDYLPTSDVPTTVIRSKADMKDYDKNFMVSSNDLVIDKIIAVVAGAGETAIGGDKKRVKRRDKEKAAAEAEAKRKEAEAKRAAAAASVATPAADDEDDEDIFADAGRDYKLEVKERESAAGRAPQRPAAAVPYFMNPDEDPALSSIKKEAADTPDGADNSITKLVAESMGMLTALEGSSAAQKIVNHLDSEATLEIGPGDLTTAVDTEIVVGQAARKRLQEEKYSKKGGSTTQTEDPSSATDSRRVNDDLLADLDSGSDGDDDAADLTQMDMGVRQNKRRQLQRFDFEDEADWFKYKEEQVHIPKAAFQFGVKAAEGRSKPKQAGRGGDAAKKRNYDAKLNKEFQQLNKVYSDKYGTGLSGEAGGSKKSGARGKGGDGGGTGNNKRQKRD